MKSGTVRKIPLCKIREENNEHISSYYYTLYKVVDAYGAFLYFQVSNSTIKKTSLTEFLTQGFKFYDDTYHHLSLEYVTNLSKKIVCIKR